VIFERNNKKLNSSAFEMQTKIVDNEAAVIETLCQEIERLANSAIEANSVFRVGLSGEFRLRCIIDGSRSLF
jgi:hypothetical protein